MFKKSVPNKSKLGVDTSVVFPKAKQIAAGIVSVAMVVALWYCSRQAEPEAPAPENTIAHVAPAPAAYMPR